MQAGHRIAYMVFQYFTSAGCGIVRNLVRRLTHPAQPYRLNFFIL